MKTTLLYPLFLLLMLSCKAQNSGEYYFQFDAIEHYRIEVNEREFFGHVNDTTLTPTEQLRYDIILKDTPETLQDSAFVTQLKELGFTKTNVTKDKFNSINEIFKTKRKEEITVTACAAIYRDILIFRNKGKITGIAKICFSCEKHHIIGTDVNTFDFGQDGGYNELEKILKK